MARRQSPTTDAPTPNHNVDLRVDSDDSTFGTRGEPAFDTGEIAVGDRVTVAYDSKRSDSVLARTGTVCDLSYNHANGVIHTVVVDDDDSDRRTQFTPDSSYGVPYATSVTSDDTHTRLGDVEFVAVDHARVERHFAVPEIRANDSVVDALADAGVDFDDPKYDYDHNVTVGDTVSVYDEVTDETSTATVTDVDGTNLTVSYDDGFGTRAGVVSARDVDLVDDSTDDDGDSTDDEPATEPPTFADVFDVVRALSVGDRIEVTYAHKSRHYKDEYDETTAVDVYVTKAETTTDDDGSRSRFRLRTTETEPDAEYDGTTRFVRADGDTDPVFLFESTGPARRDCSQLGRVDDITVIDDSDDSTDDDGDSDDDARTDGGFTFVGDDDSDDAAFDDARTDGGTDDSDETYTDEGILPVFGSDMSGPTASTGTRIDFEYETLSGNISTKTGTVTGYDATRGKEPGDDGETVLHDLTIDTESDKSAFQINARGEVYTRQNGGRNTTSRDGKQTVRRGTVVSLDVVDE